MISEALEAQRLEREPEWTESIGVGSREFVEEVAGRTGWRVQLEMRETAEGVWTLREPEAPYAEVRQGGVRPIFGAEN
jgi:hypothetical protein